MAVNESPSSEHGDSPVTIRRYVSGVGAAMDAAVLQSNGIDASVVGDEAGDSLGFGMAVRKAQLVVPSRQAGRAELLLNEVATTVPGNRQTDWKCSACGEVNGRQFDHCWSCEKEWTSADLEYEPEQLAQPLPSADAPPIVLPEQDRNPYAAPVIGTVVAAAPGEAAEDDIRRTMRGVVLGTLFPPILLFVVLMGFHSLSQFAAGQRQASSAQYRKLVIITSVAAIELLVFAGIFMIL